MSKLAAALRAKFGTPKRVIEALQLDPSLLDDARKEALLLAQDAARARARDENGVVREESTAWSRHPSVEEAKRMEMAGEFDGDDQITAGEVEAIVRMLKEKGVDSRVVQKVMYALQSDENSREEMPALDEEMREKIAGFLRAKGMSEDDVSEVFRLKGLPKNGLPNAGSMGRGLGMGGRLQGMAGDAATVARLAKRFPGIERIAADLNFGVHRHEIDRRPGPSRAQLKRLHARFPGMAGIKVGG